MKKNIIGTTTYGYEFASAVNKDNIYGFQPHPEKSHDNGLRILKNFVNIKKRIFMKTISNYRCKWICREQF